MERAEIIEGKPFDWDSGAEAMRSLVDKDGNVNWRAAWAADPGVTKCPGCLAYYWAEGTRLRCPKCKTEFDTYPKRSDLTRGSHE